MPGKSSQQIKRLAVRVSRSACLACEPLGRMTDRAGSRQCQCAAPRRPRPGPDHAHVERPPAPCCLCEARAAGILRPRHLLTRGIFVMITSLLRLAAGALVSARSARPQPMAQTTPAQPPPPGAAPAIRWSPSSTARPCTVPTSSPRPRRCRAQYRNKIDQLFPGPGRPADRHHPDGRRGAQAEAAGRSGGEGAWSPPTRTRRSARCCCAASSKDKLSDAALKKRYDEIDEGHEAPGRGAGQPHPGGDRRTRPRTSSRSSRGGADFAKLAKEKSTDPGADQRRRSRLFHRRRHGAGILPRPPS